MKKSMISTTALVLAFMLCGCFTTGSAQENASARPDGTKQITIHMAGDSTCANYAASSALTGWGQVLNEYCKPGIRVNNLAKSGCSSKSFIDIKRWDMLLGMVKPGDYVIVQFGHNDSKKDKKRFTDPKTTYSANLKKFIADVRARKANPIIATSISRCIFKKGKIASSGLIRYRDAAIAVAKAENVPVIDLNRITEEKFNAMGEAKAFAYFRGDYEEAPNKKKAAKAGAKQPQKHTDRTHLKRSGALEVAEWFVADCKAQKLPIADCFK